MRLMCVNYFKVTLILAFPAIIKVEASGTSPKTTIEIKLKQKSTTKTNSAQIIKIKQK